MRVVVDDASPVPPYEQVREQVARLILSGALTAGTRLPSIRQLAGDLGLAPGTVARAYAELEREGLVGGRGRHGTRVREAPPRDRGDGPPGLADLAHVYAARAAELGAAPDQAVEAVRRAVLLALPPSGNVPAGRRPHAPPAEG
jgi:DNA-binding transcriptional regulator YhcF (GntR family)